MRLWYGEVRAGRAGEVEDECTEEAVSSPSTNFDLFRDCAGRHLRTCRAFALSDIAAQPLLERGRQAVLLTDLALISWLGAPSVHCTMSDDENSSKQRRQADRARRKADKRRTAEEARQTDKQQRHEEEQHEENSTAAQQPNKKSKRADKEASAEAEEGREGEREEEAKDQRQQETSSKPRVVVKKTSEGDEYVDVRQHSRPTHLIGSTQHVPHPREH